MGLFSSKKKHFVDSAVVRVIEDDYLPDVLKKSVLEASVKNLNISDTLIGNIIGGTSFNFESAYRYAQRADGYTFGTPDVLLYSSDVSKDLVLPAINAQANGTVDRIEYAVYRPLNNFFMAWKLLYETLSYQDESTDYMVADPQGNTFIPDWVTPNDNADGSTPLVYLEQIEVSHASTPGQEVEVSSLGSVETRLSKEGQVPGQAATQRANTELLGEWDAREVITIGSQETEGFTLHAVWEELAEGETEGKGTLVRSSQFFDLSEDYDEDKEYFQAKVIVRTQNELRPFYFVYRPGEGTYPELDNYLKTPEQVDNGEYFPFVVFRQEAQNRASKRFENTEQFKTTEKLCEKIGFDFVDMAAEIHGKEDDPNEGIDDIRQAVMTMAVPITTEDPIQLEYLFLYFNELIERIGLQPTPPKQEIGNYLGDQATFATEFTDADFSLFVSFDGIERNIVAGIIGDVGTMTNDESIRDFQEDFSSFGSNIFIASSAPVNSKTRTLRRQILPNAYEEIVITNPQFRYKVFEDKGVEGGKDDERLLIPVNMRLARNFALVERELLYTSSLNFVFNSHKIEKVKWYQRGAFKAILIIIAVVLTLWDGGFTFAQVIAALAAGGAAAAIMTWIIISTFIQVMLIGKILSMAIKKVAQIVGIEVAQVLAVIAVAFAAYGYITNSAVIFNATPMQLIDVASNLIDASISMEFEDLISDYEDFEAYKEEKMELLEAAQDLLGDPLNIDPMLFVYREPIFVPGESPDAFFERTIENTNPGAASLDFIQNYFDISLRLPT